MNQNRLLAIKTGAQMAAECSLDAKGFLISAKEALAFVEALNSDKALRIEDFPDPLNIEQFRLFKKHYTRHGAIQLAALRDSRTDHTELQTQKENI